MDQHCTPFASAVMAYRNSNYTVFNTPGHKAGKGIHPAIRDLLGSRAFSSDICDVLGSPGEALDPDEVLRVAEELLAQAYGVGSSRFIVNGSTAGVQAALLAASGKGLLDRNAHKSAVEGLILSGATPAYVPCSIDPTYGIPLPMRARDIHSVRDSDSALPDFLLLTSPTYHGMAADLPEITSEAHALGIPVIVDEAHGPHFHFNTRLPVSAVDAGADVCVQSAHKVLGALTQASFLHHNGSMIDGDSLDSAVDMLQSTSPSYLLCASLDVARMQMATLGQGLWEKTVELALRTRARINAIEGLECIDASHIGLPEETSNGRPSADPTRLTVSVQSLGISGVSAARFLRRLGVEPEMGDLSTVVFILTWADDQQTADRLVSALKLLAGTAGADRAEVTAVPNERDIISEMKAILCRIPPPKVVMSPREARFSHDKTVSPKLCVGRISAEIVAPYPPGVPLICPGEVIPPEAVRYLELARSLGVKVSGPVDNRMKTIRVVS